MAGSLRRRRVAFLFLGETLLIPHLWPIVEALAAADPALPIDCWVATSIHEGLLTRWAWGLPNVRIRRAPVFLPLQDDGSGRNPPLPPKLRLLAGLLPHLLKARVAVCAEQTSLWLPTLLPFLPIRFIKTAHGAGSMMARDDRRRRAAWMTLVPGEREREAMIARGLPAKRVVTTGYVKAGFRQRTGRASLFTDGKPILLYTPHWQRHRSSWWAWGQEVIDILCAQQAFNVILAPHQRLVEKVPDLWERLAAAARYPHVHADLDSFAMVDGSYTEAADLYLGDTSSQVVEFLARPRPCVFLNPQGITWQGRQDYDFWTCGEVIDRLDRLPAALEQAAELHPSYREVQQRFASASLGDTSGEAPVRAAEAILSAL